MTPSFGALLATYCHTSGYQPRDILRWLRAGDRELIPSDRDILCAQLLPLTTPAQAQLCLVFGLAPDRFSQLVVLLSELNVTPALVEAGARHQS